jgi:hypothetical protein
MANGRGTEMEMGKATGTEMEKEMDAVADIIHKSDRSGRTANEKGELQPPFFI